MIRHFAERLTRSWRYTRRLPAEYGGGKIVVSPAGGLRYLFRSMSDVDPTLLDLAREFIKPKDVVWDIGANVGLFSFAAAGLTGSAGSVLAIEPDTWLVDLLRRSSSLQRANAAQVNVLPCAVASTPGCRTFQLARRSRSANYLEGFGTTQTGGSAETQLVPTLTLDLISESRRAPALIKIDVEGAEVEVLKGATKVFSSIRPIVICEVAKENAFEITEFFHSRAYVLLDGESRPYDRIPKPTAPYLTVAIPN